MDAPEISRTAHLDAAWRSIGVSPAAIDSLVAEVNSTGVEATVDGCVVLGNWRPDGADGWMMVVDRANPERALLLDLERLSDLDAASYRLPLASNGRAKWLLRSANASPPRSGFARPWMETLFEWLDLEDAWCCLVATPGGGVTYDPDALWKHYGFECVDFLGCIYARPPQVREVTSGLA